MRTPLRQAWGRLWCTWQGHFYCRNQNGSAHPTTAISRKHHKRNRAIAVASKATHANRTGRRSRVLRSMICGDVVVACPSTRSGSPPAAAAGVAASLYRPSRPWNLLGNCEAANHRLGLTIVNIPAVPTVNPLRVTERRIFIASSRRVIGWTKLFQNRS